MQMDERNSPSSAEGSHRKLKEMEEKALNRLLVAKEAKKATTLRELKDVDFARERYRLDSDEHENKNLPVTS